MKCFREIWNLQRELNSFIGRDTVGSVDKQKWFFDYVWAANGELIELADCFKINKDGYVELVDEQNSKVEWVDVLHFLVSSMQCLLTLDEVESFVLSEHESEEHFYEHLKRALVATSTIMEKVVLVKWWVKEAKEGKPRFVTILNKELGLDLLKTAWKHFMIVGRKLGYTDEQILDLYKQKHKINFERQNQNYSIKGKTEADNLNIS
jgi:dimeric dUTPase (all-alpha-NTP-PPase superfamily)